MMVKIYSRTGLLYARRKEDCRRKGSLTDRGTRVPLIANWPCNQSGNTSNQLIDCSDFPTHLSVSLPTLSQEILKLMAIRSHAQFLEGRKFPKRSWVYMPNEEANTLFATKTGEALQWWEHDQKRELRKKRHPSQCETQLRCQSG